MRHANTIRSEYPLQHTCDVAGQKIAEASIAVFSAAGQEIIGHLDDTRHSRSGELQIVTAEQPESDGRIKRTPVGDENSHVTRPCGIVPDLGHKAVPETPTAEPTRAKQMVTGFCVSDIRGTN